MKSKKKTCPIYSSQDKFECCANLVDEKLTFLVCYLVAGIVDVFCYFIGLNAR